MSNQELTIPPRLIAMMQAGVWPQSQEASEQQNLHPRVAPERVRRLAPKEETIYLYAPPFAKVGDLAATAPEFWYTDGALDQIIPELSLVIADFGIGSDAPIALDYRRSTQAPTVIRLHWSEDGGRNNWILCAESFDAFADLLGLDRPADSRG
jgi:hypothetical protein